MEQWRNPGYAYRHLGPDHAPKFGHREVAITRANLPRAVLLASVVVAHAPWLSGTEAAAQTAQAQARAMPMFEVDPSWPKVPPQWRLGDASSIGIDAQDNIWVLHRPRTLKPEQAGAAAPPILVFDAAGDFHQGLGRGGERRRIAEYVRGIHIDHKGFVWVGGNNCPARALLGAGRMATTSW